MRKLQLLPAAMANLAFSASHAGRTCHFKRVTRTMVAGMAICTAIAAPAAADVIPTYRITSPYNIGPILLFDRGIYPGSGGVSGAFTTRGNQSGGFSTVPGTTIITSNPTDLLGLRSFFLGVTDLIPGALAQDPDAPAHLILGTGNFYGASLIGQEFIDLFPGYDEATLIGAVRTVADFNLGNDVEVEPEFAQAFSLVAGFEDMLFSTAPNSHFALNEGFSILAFSQGQLAGVGDFSATAVGGVPEPASWAMLIAGFGLTGAAMRRRTLRGAVSA